MGLLGSAYYGTLHYSGVAALARARRLGAAVLCYHNVVASTEEARLGGRGLHMPVSEFRGQMEWLAGHYDVISLDELVEGLDQGHRFRRTAVVTFDDAYEGVLEHALPITRTLGIPSTLFVVGQGPGHAPFWWDRPGVVRAATDDRRSRWLLECQGDAAQVFREVGPTSSEVGDLPASHYPATWERLSRVAAAEDITIGAHTRTHRHLPSLSDEDLESELVEGADCVEEALGARPVHFAYPYGAWSVGVRSAVAAAGYTSALTLDHGLNGGRWDRLALKRTNIPTGLPSKVFAAWVAGLMPGGSG